MKNQLASSDSTTRKTLKALFWRASEKGAQYGIQIVLQIVLARLLAPDDYGVYAVLAAFVALFGIVIEGGLPSALIQDKDANEDDYSIVFWSNIILSIVVVVAIFFLAPSLAVFFNMESLSNPLRTASLSLVLQVYNSLLVSRFMKSLDFRAIFLRTIIALVVSGVVGVIIALMGFGIWALVWQQISYQFSVLIYFAVRSKWYPTFVFKFSRLKELLSFGWKICVSSILKSGYDSFLDLMLGKYMSSNSLGLYNRGRKFAQVASSVVDDPIKTVLFPAFSTRQDNSRVLITSLRDIVTVYSFVSIPLMMIAAFFGEDIIVLLLSDTWRDAAVYFQICCVSYAVLPLSTPSLSLFNAIGKSALPMIMEGVRLVLTILGFLLAVWLGYDNIILIIVVTGVSLLSSLLVMIPNNTVLGYSFLMQLYDYGRPLLCTAASMLVLFLVNMFFPLRGRGFLSVVVFCAFILLYIVCSKAMGIRGFETIAQMIRSK